MGGPTSGQPQAVRLPGGPHHAGHYLADRVRSTALRDTLEQAARLLGFPLGRVSIADDTSLHTLASTGGLDVPGTVREQLPCGEVIATARPLAIPDLSAGRGPALQDPYCRIVCATADVRPPAESDYPLLAAAGVRAYLGVPLRGREGTVVGSLSLMDTERHVITPAQTALLQKQAEIVEDHLDLHRRRSDLRLLAEEDGAGAAVSTPRADGGRRAADPPGTANLAAATADLRRGLHAGEVVAHYEPIVDVVTGRVEGLEALARWQHPHRGLLPPATFIPLAEDSDLIIELDLVVLARAVEQLRRWQGSRPDLRVNVNLSGRHLAHAGCIERIRRTVTDAGVEPSSVGLEITESALVALTPQATAFVEQLRALGFAILFDDFGTGWASLSYLLHLPADAVKVDRSFTAALPTRTGTAVMSAILTMARDLGLGTVVEGVTCAGDAARTRDLGFRSVQGHYYSPAVPAADLPW